MTTREYLLPISESERVRLNNRIAEDVSACLADHKIRMDRAMEYYRKWRNRYTASVAGEEDASNFQVPLTSWFVWTKWAKLMDSLFGDDAEIVAIPIGPSDERNVAKIGRYMSWKVLHEMRLVNPLAVFLFRAILFGRSHAYAPWHEETHEVDYRGVKFYPLWPDDLLVPAEDAETIHDFSFVVRRFRASLDDLLIGEQEGRYEKITENQEQILNSATENRSRRNLAGEADQVKVEKDEGEGVLYEGGQSARESLEVQCWYGRWRMLRGDRQADADETDLKNREPIRRELVVYRIPDLELIIGVQDLGALYPGKKLKRPLVEAALCKDGSYWCKGFGETLFEIEEEMSVNHNLGTDAGELSVGPLIFYRPATGFSVQKFRYEPKMAIPLDNPATDVRVEQVRADLSFTTLKEQSLLGYAERQTGLTDVSMGRALDRPNAPRTATQYVSLLEEGNVRASLDVTFMREDFSAILDHIWQLDTIFNDERVFFRVTEEEANGLFPIRQGGAFLRRSDRTGRYDFRLKFASSVYSRERRKEQRLALFQLDLQNPLIIQNPRALWVVTNALHEAMGDHQFRNILPEPPDLELSIPPKEEFVRVLQGEEIYVRPFDNDELHMLEHDQQLARMQADPDSDQQAQSRLADHYVKHARQMQQKRMMQALTQEAMKRLPEFDKVQGLGGGNGIHMTPDSGVRPFGRLPSI